MRHTKVWTVSLPPEMEREAQRLARKEHRTKSELVREALRNYVVSRRLAAIQRVGVARASRQGIRTDVDIERLIDDIRS